ncbi:hypothetical protein C491_16912 [Natronococcus amylolyticus DSM 10524]|uniref:Halobacterial output domain-containing protein n=1 Tax=Natronococcus amylolyticus DSM 10524 TaxID=1227497 RepID=L9X0Y4_9EURY|nr:HalOD1 output domain-containing protein [Natronococcus amylolyticus]ELY55414.1 hypothetical protein C491_16912 [Natronococcus amylolyticus DSM 10524]
MTNNGRTTTNNDNEIERNGSDLGRDTRRRQVTQRHYDPARDGELTTAIVFAVAEAEGVSPSEVTSPPLYDSVDVAAIEDAFFGSESESEPRRGAGVVEFRYVDYLLKVRSDGWILVCESTGVDPS